MYGRVEVPINPFVAQAHNIEFFGELAHSSVPRTLSSFDVGIIPFVLTELTAATDPVKIYEYLAAGLPVVSTTLPELSILKPPGTFLAGSATEFVDSICKSLTSHTDTSRREARRWAKNCDWSVRATEFLGVDAC